MSAAVVVAVAEASPSPPSATPPGPVITIGTSGMLFRFGVAFSIAVIVIGILAWHRKSLPALAPTRARRLAIEVVALWAFQLAAGTVAAVTDVKGAFAGTVAAKYNISLWALPFLGAGVVILQAFASLRRDVADAVSQSFEVDRARLNAMLHDARANRDFFYLVSKAFLKVVSIKRERLKKATTAVDLVRAFKPDEQAIALVIACYEIFNAMINPSRNDNNKVRVAYFKVEGSALVPSHSYNGTSHDCVALTRSSEVLPRFSFDHPDGCAARSASKTGVPFWVPSAATAHSEASNPFVFFREEQRDALKSMVAMPIRLDGETGPFDVVTVDTDRDGFFDRGKRGEEVAHVIENLAHRLQMERAIGLLNKER